MGDTNHWVHKAIEFLEYCRDTLDEETETSHNFGQNLQLSLPPAGFMRLLHGNREMPNRCRVFLGFVNVLAVAIVVGLALESTSPDDPHDHVIQDQRNVNERDPRQDQHSRHEIQTLTVGPSKLPGEQEEVVRPKASEPGETGAGTSTTSQQCVSVCDYCAALAKKAVRLLADCGYSGDEEHTARPTNCKNCGLSAKLPPPLPLAHLESVTTTGNDIRAAEDELEGDPTESQAADQSHPEQNQVTFYWRNRVLEILAPSLAPLPNLFPDSENMSEIVYETGGDVVEGAREGYQGRDRQISSEQVGNGVSHETSQENSHGLEDEAALDADDNLETILENEENDAGMQRARIRTHEMNDSSSAQYNLPQTRVEIHLSAPCPHPGPPQIYSGFPGSLTVLTPRPASAPGARRNDSRSNTPTHSPRSIVVTYTPRSQPTEMVQPEFNDAPQAEYYDNNRGPYHTGTLSDGENTVSGLPDYSSSDDDEGGSQSSSSSTPVPSGSTHLHLNSTPSRDRFRPRGRILARRPKCGLRMMKALRDDPSCIPEEGPTRRQPGREDKDFSPRRGDVICRHTVVPGRGVVEIFIPGIEQHLQDGDSLIRLQMDNTSYPTMLILSVKAYLFLQGRWMYLGRHQHGVRKPKKERPPG